jgi:hypothetical protein
MRTLAPTGGFRSAGSWLALSEVRTPLQDVVVEDSVLDILHRHHVADLYRPINQVKNLPRRDGLQRAPRKQHARRMIDLPRKAAAGDVAGGRGPGGDHMTMALVKDTPESIELCFYGWHVWRSRRGDELVSWCATRLDPSVGVSPTVICDTPSALRVALAYEAKLSRRASHAPPGGRRTGDLPMTVTAPLLLSAVTREAAPADGVRPVPPQTAAPSPGAAAPEGAARAPVVFPAPTTTHHWPPTAEGGK